ncbi:hypothetical protein AALP_AA6G248900 [Arabis alpina]|uniref:Uncharacterized protein n=1 Tax=Arabis alpina TaxID=50452 RepID=A0A087GRI5_ARAAL|nr:hypothetical protein AALP_AA6G248900 [Arabis alpina]
MTMNRSINKAEFSHPRSHSDQTSVDSDDAYTRETAEGKTTSTDQSTKEELVRTKTTPH